MSDQDDTPPRHRIPVEVETEEVQSPFSARTKLASTGDPILASDEIRIWTDDDEWVDPDDGRGCPRVSGDGGQWVIELPIGWSADDVRVFRVEVHE